MNLEMIDRNYYFDKMGTAISEIDLIRGDCLPLNTYIVLKKKYSGLDNLFELILDDINFGIMLSKEKKIQNLYYNNQSIIEAGILEYTNYEFMESGEFALKSLEEIIDSKQLVMIQTIQQLLPYSKTYDPDFKKELYNPGHIQIIVGYDDNNYYFVDDPAQINYSRFNAYSNDVGILSKNEALVALGTYLNCLDVNINFEQYKKIDGVIDDIIREAIRGYGKEPFYFQENRCFYGREAIKCLIDISESEYINLNECDSSLGMINLFLRWKFRAIKNKRHIWLLYFQKKCNGLENSRKIKSLLEKDYNGWEIVWNLFEKRYMKKLFLWNKRYTESFRNILKIEDELFHELAINYD